jgi:hypothetical protein
VRGFESYGVEDEPAPQKVAERLKADDISRMNEEIEEISNIDISSMPIPPREAAPFQDYFTHDDNSLADIYQESAHSLP